MAINFSMTSKIKKIIKKIVFRFIKPQIQYTGDRNSYSQAGEDSILTFLFYSLKIFQPTYIDVGANQPQSGSNTFLFYLRGSKGICIEPDKNLFTDFVKARPLDKCLNVAIGNNNENELDFFVFDEPSVNTLSKKDAQERIDGGELKHIDTVKVKVEKLEEIIKEHCATLPDFISLDIEGVDFDVLKAFDFDAYRVPVWVVETVNYSPNPQKIKNNLIIELMQSKSYFVYADTYINTIFVLKEWYDNYRIKNNATL